MQTWRKEEALARSLVGAEQMSPVGSASPTIVSVPLPPSVSFPVPFRTLITPLVWPATRFSRPGVEGPNVVLLRRR